MGQHVISTYRTQVNGQTVASFSSLLFFLSRVYNINPLRLTFIPIQPIFHLIGYKPLLVRLRVPFLLRILTNQSFYFLLQDAFSRPVLYLYISTTDYIVNIDFYRRSYRKSIFIILIIQEASFSVVNTSTRRTIPVRVFLSIETEDGYSTYSQNNQFLR